MPQVPARSARRLTVEIRLLVSATEHIIIAVDCVVWKYDIKHLSSLHNAYDIKLDMINMRNYILIHSGHFDCYVPRLDTRELCYFIVCIYYKRLKLLSQIQLGLGQPCRMSRAPFQYKDAVLLVWVTLC